MISDTWVLWQTQSQNQNQEPDQWQWCLPSTDGRFTYPVQSGSLATAANMIGSQSSLLLIRSEQLLMTEATVQARHTKQIRTALPYLLEEQLATSPERLHFSFMKGDKPNEFHVVVVAQQLFSKLIEQITAAGIRLTGAYADSHGLPNLPDHATVIIDNNRVLFRSANLGFAAPVSIAGYLINKAHQNGKKIRCYLTRSNSQQQTEITHLTEALGITEDQCQTISAPLELLARGLNPDQSVNLLQGSFKQAISRAQQPLPNITKWLLIILLGLPAANFWQQNRHHLERIQQTAQQINTIHQQQFGTPAPTNDFRAKINQQLNRLHHRQSDPRQTLPMTDLLSKFSALKPVGITVTGIDYDGSKLSLVIKASDLNNADLLRSRIETAQMLDQFVITNHQSNDITITVTLAEPN